MELFAFPGLVVLALAIPGFVALVAAVYVAVWYLRTVVFARKPQPLAPLPGSQQRHVVITGCDTGLGRTLAEIFAGKSGYFVHALCLSKAAAQELDATSDRFASEHIGWCVCRLVSLSCFNSIHGVVCDVTNDQQVTAAVDAVSHSTTSVWALINNVRVSRCGCPTNLRAISCHAGWCFWRRGSRVYQPGHHTTRYECQLLWLNPSGFGVPTPPGTLPVCSLLHFSSGD